MNRNKKWKFSVSVTTRIPRDGEVDGKDYKFISNSEFEHNVKFGDFIEWEIVHGNKYGTLWSNVENASGVMIFDIDVKGGLAIKEASTSAAFSFGIPFVLTNFKVSLYALAYNSA